jgi:hypothetical protein
MRTAPHIHVTRNAEIVGTLYLEVNGHVADDGTPAAKNAIDYTNHGCRREDGQIALDAIVAHLGRSTLVGAHHCHEDHRESGASKVERGVVRTERAGATPSQLPRRCERRYGLCRT